MMLVAAIITGIMSLFLLIFAGIRFYRDGEGAASMWLGFFVGLVWLVCFLFSLNLQVSTQNLTGYIYASEDQVGYTTAHIRFSEQAGTDSQPSFCVKTDSEAGNKIHEYAGSGKKVKVTIPPYFYFANNPFTCGTTKTTIVAQ